MKELEKEFSDFFSILLKSYSLEDLPAKVMSVLYLEPKEIAMEDIARETGYSLASICTTMKFLENLGMVKRIRKPGTRKAFFYMEKDLFRLNIQKLKASHEHIVQPAKSILPNIIKKYKQKAKDEESKKKLQIIQNYYKQVLEFEVIIDKWTKDLESMFNNRKKVV